MLRRLFIGFNEIIQGGNQLFRGGGVWQSYSLRSDLWPTASFPRVIFSMGASRSCFDLPSNLTSIEDNKLLEIGQFTKPTDINEL